MHSTMPKSAKPPSATSHDNRQLDLPLFAGPADEHALAPSAPASPPWHDPTPNGARVQRLTLGGLIPDLTLILDVSVETGFARIAARPGGADRFERLDREFHERLRQGFLDIAAKEPSRCALIGAAGDADMVHRATLEAVNERLGVSLIC